MTTSNYILSPEVQALAAQYEIRCPDDEKLVGFAQALFELGATGERRTLVFMLKNPAYSKEMLLEQLAG